MDVVRFMTEIRVSLSTEFMPRVFFFDYVQSNAGFNDQTTRILN